MCHSTISYLHFGFLCKNIAFYGERRYNIKYKAAREAFCLEATVIFLKGAIRNEDRTNPSGIEDRT